RFSSRRWPNATRKKPAVPDRGRRAKTTAVKPASAQRRRRPDFFRNARGVLLEVLAEHRRQLGCLLVVGGGIGPALARLKNVVRDAFDRSRNLEAEDRVGRRRGVGQLARERRADDPTRPAERDPLADA